MTRPSTLSAADIEAIHRAVDALPKLSPEQLDDIATSLARIRESARQRHIRERLSLTAPEHKGAA